MNTLTEYLNPVFQLVVNQVSFSGNLFSLALPDDGIKEVVRTVAEIEKFSGNNNTRLGNFIGTEKNHHERIEPESNKDCNFKGKLMSMEPSKETNQLSLLDEELKRTTECFAALLTGVNDLGIDFGKFQSPLRQVMPTVTQALSETSHTNSSMSNAGTMQHLVNASVEKTSFTETGISRNTLSKNSEVMYSESIEKPFYKNNELSVQYSVSGLPIANDYFKNGQTSSTENRVFWNADTIITKSAPTSVPEVLPTIYHSVFGAKNVGAISSLLGLKDVLPNEITWVDGGSNYIGASVLPVANRFNDTKLFDGNKLTDSTSNNYHIPASIAKKQFDFSNRVFEERVAKPGRNQARQTDNKISTIPATNFSGRNAANASGKRTITINVNKPLLENFIVQVKDSRDGVSEFKRQVEEVLLEILNMANV